MPVISTNTAANTAVRFLNINASDQSSSLAKLASGSNINKASDDAAGLAIATKISSDVAALEQASTNSSHGISVLQTADGGASNIADIVERMKVLASQSASGTVTAPERAYIQAEFEQLQEEIDGITESTRYNGQSLLNGTSDFADETVETAPKYEGVGAQVTSLAPGATGTIKINGIEIELSLATDVANTYDVSEMVKQINDALHDHGEYTIEAKDESGTLTINTLRKGADIELKFEDVGTPAGSALQLSTLGLDAASLATGTNTTKGTTVPSADTGAEIIVGSTSADTINLSIESLTTSKLGIADLNVSSEEGAAKALSVLDLAIDRISNARAELGATMSRFEFRSAQIDTSVENLKAAESAIRDVDIAKEQAQLSASTVKVQAAVAAASQANEMPQNLLSLIR